MLTSIGDDNLLMAYVHVAHDVHLGQPRRSGQRARRSADTSTVGDWAWIGASSGVHQFCRIGRHAIIGGYSVITQDVLPFSNTVSEREIKVFGANKIGLERRGFSAETIDALAQGVPAADARGAQYHRRPSSASARKFRPAPEVEELLEFIATSRARIHQMTCR